VHASRHTSFSDARKPLSQASGTSTVTAKHTRENAVAGDKRDGEPVAEHLRHSRGRAGSLRHDSRNVHASTHSITVRRCPAVTIIDANDSVIFTWRIDTTCGPPTVEMEITSPNNFDACGVMIYINCGPGDGMD